MSGAIPLLPPYAFMAWCSVKKSFDFKTANTNAVNYKVKVKLPLCFEHHAMKAYWGSGV
jgi:hypothetical protein